MKSIKKEKIKEIKYPCLMVAEDGEVVLFKKESTGTTIHQTLGGLLGLGFYTNLWDMGKFKPHNGDIIINNDYIRGNDKAGEYPCVMVSSDDDVVLFREEGRGTVIYLANEYDGAYGSIGYHSGDWHMGDFKPFNGYIILSND